ncbi:MAG TPA: sulfatase [Thermoanaerobaculia bacterium]|nr:sulfatase [Thermoanaerobaculia bacterium]
MRGLPLLVASLSLLCLACRPAAAPPYEPLPARSNVLLVTIDTLRADHLSAYGYARPTSPAIDRLAAEGVRFDHAVVQWPKTGPSFASMFTATYPKDNGIVRKVGIPLPCRFRMLAEELRAQGYATHAVVANGAVGREFFFDQGFDTYVETWKLPPGRRGEDPNLAAAVTRLAAGVLDRIDRSRPYFLWVHYLDPHWPYAPPAPWTDRFQGDAHWDGAARIPIAAGKARQEMMGIGEGQALDGRDELAFYVARYDAEIAYTDAQVGGLLAAARRRGLLERTLTVLTSDHGESLGDHHYFFDHGRFGFQSCLRVPLVFHYPGVLAPRVDRAPAALVHLAPTLLAAAGVELPDGAWRQGRSLVPRLRGAPPAPDDPTAVAFAEAGYEQAGQWQKIVQDGRWKLIYAQGLADQRWIAGEGVRFALFDLARDPGETRNVAGAHPAERQRLLRTLWQWDRAPRFDPLVEPASAACGEERGMERETEELLRSLGYI